MAEKRTKDLYSTARPKERALLVGVDLGQGEWSCDESLAELSRLAETDGAEVIFQITQKLDRPHRATFIGKGKVEELVGYVQRLNIDVVIFDDELTPSQQSNLEHAVGKKTKIIDRTALILDIFGEHATTKEGRLQVQLAQLQYVYPRLRGMWSNLVTEQQRGGIGGRFGAGESQLEVDRRLVKNRMSSLNAELKKLDIQRQTQSKARRISGVFSVALAGYTNAGKSTLLNRLSNADVYVKDELFATLDPTTRTVVLPEGRKITLTDTVGFIQKLPHTLVKAFNSTLAEVVESDLILKVVDASDPHQDKELNAVDEVLHVIGARDIPSVVVYNKCDLLSEEELNVLMTLHKDALFISALDGVGLQNLMYKISKEAAKGSEILTCLLPYDKGSFTNLIHERCQVIREQYTEDGLLITARIPEELLKTFVPYRICDTKE